MRQCEERRSWIGRYPSYIWRHYQMNLDLDAGHIDAEERIGFWRLVNEPLDSCSCPSCKQRCLAPGKYKYGLDKLTELRAFTGGTVLRAIPGCNNVVQSYRRIVRLHSISASWYSWDSRAVSRRRAILAESWDLLLGGSRGRIKSNAGEYMAVL